MKPRVLPWLQMSSGWNPPTTELTNATDLYCTCDTPTTRTKQDIVYSSCFENIICAYILLERSETSEIPTSPPHFNTLSGTNGVTRNRDQNLVVPAT